MTGASFSSRILAASMNLTPAAGSVGTPITAAMPASLWSSAVSGLRRTATRGAPTFELGASGRPNPTSPASSTNPAGTQLYPRNLWRPYYVSKDSYRRLHNTDPFIFGDRFLYSNCKQQTNSRLARLGRGSVIAFGSGRTIAHERKWALDTVLVVADSFTYAAPDARQALAHAAPEAFLAVTGDPIADNGKGLFRLYRGATPDDPVEGMFSCLPCNACARRHRLPATADRPSQGILQPKELAGPEGSTARMHERGTASAWESVAAQVREAGLVLGTYAALPERRKE